jgi:hypothetical protein
VSLLRLQRAVASLWIYALPRKKANVSTPNDGLELTGCGANRSSPRPAVYRSDFVVAEFVS